jgi:hypothetical protein
MILEMWCVMSTILRNPITIPIYYTKYISENERLIPEKYKQILGTFKN